MANLTNGAAANSLNWLTGNTTTAPTAPLKIRLMTANGSASAAGTEVTNAGGSAYASQSVTFTAAVGTGSSSNTADVVFTNMPAATIVGIEIWDSAVTPVRWWFGAATAPKTTNLGDTLKILAGQLALADA